MVQPLMPKATAVWLVDNTTLTFDQIADFCTLHPLEVKGIADDEVAVGIKGQDPVATGQLTMEEIKRCEASPIARLQIADARGRRPERRSAGPRYTPVSKRQDRPNAIAWLVRYHPELSDAQVSKLVGTTKPTIQSVRDRSHWNISNITPQDPVTLGLCTQIELDGAVQKAQAKLDKQRALEEAERDRMRQENLAAAEEAGLPSVAPAEDDPIAPEPADAEPEAVEEEKETDISSVFEDSPQRSPEVDEENDRSPLRPEDVFKS